MESFMVWTRVLYKVVKLGCFRWKGTGLQIVRIKSRCTWSQPNNISVTVRIVNEQKRNVTALLCTSQN
jgi:hypothetical protein